MSDESDDQSAYENVISESEQEPEQEADDGLEPSSKRKRAVGQSQSNLDRLKDHTLPPRKATWNLLYAAKFAPSKTAFIQRIEEIRVTDHPYDTDCQFPTEFYSDAIKSINTVVMAENEGYAILICSLVLSHIVEELNLKYNTEGDGPVHFKLQVLPSIKQNNSGKADYSILRVKNVRHIVVMEVKRNVGFRPDMKDYAQLVLESIYLSNMMENRDVTEFVAILADDKSFHLMIIDVHLPISLKEYYFYFQPGVEILCKAIRSLLLKIGI